MSVEQLRARVREEGLIAPGGPLLAMYSGGRDSTCLLDVAVSLLGPERVCALHVNYGLRAAAGEDEEHCRRTCEQLGVELRVHAAAAERPPAAGNLQAWAREVRYREARRLAGGRGGRFATGHTASDQVETIVYRLAASPGRRALLGMPAREGRLVRPLLGMTREQTAAYCRERGLGWREDESNSDERFARTRVREGVLPALRAVHPAAEANLLRTAELLREETELLDGLVSAELDGRASIEAARLRALPRALARMIVVHLAEAVAGAYVPQAGSRVGEILELDERGGRAELHIGGSVGAVVEGGVLEMVKLPPRRD
ncbi:MAG TPA: tRNA lysidine(34) synthetase TilS [Solirubrobacteraceae bacterium]|nr:tRNA lysidine(34) synthetase TilS [Solirubrobacteraceae bacterium]